MNGVNNKPLSIDQIKNNVPPVCIGYLDPRTRRALELAQMGVTGPAFDKAMQQFDTAELGGQLEMGGEIQ